MSKGTISGWLATTALIGTAALAGAGEAWVHFSEDGHRIVVAAQGDGISKFESVSSAACKLDDQWHRIGTRSLGKNLWKVNLSGRQWVKKQSASLHRLQ